MEAFTDHPHAGAQEPRPEAVTAAPHPAVLTAAGDACPTCGAHLASDQRYCVECGQRTREARLPFMGGVPESPQEEVGALPTAPGRGLRRLSSGSTAIAGVATLLLAIGIGVLIGRTNDGSSGTAKAPPVQVVTVPGAAAAGTSATPAAGGSGSSAAPATSSTPARSGPTAPKRSASPAPAPRPSSGAPKPKVVHVGSPGSGAGYQNGHFTGNFFGQ